MKDNSIKLAKEIISALNNRGGFDHWWDSIEEDIRKNIIKEMGRVIENFEG